MVRAQDQAGITGINKGDTKVAGMFGYSDDELQRRKALSDIINASNIKIFEKNFS